MPPTVPVNVGLSNGAFKFNAVCVADDIGLFASLVLLTLSSPTALGVMVIPVIDPVNTGS